MNNKKTFCPHCGKSLEENQQQQQSNYRPIFDLDTVTLFVYTILYNVESKIEKESFSKLLFETKFASKQFKLIDKHDFSDPIVQRLHVISKTNEDFEECVISINRFIITNYC